MFRTVFDEKTKLWHGPNVPSLFNPKISIAHILLRSMKLHGSRVAQVSVDSGKQFTFDELRKMTIRAAQNLQHRNFGKGHVLAFMGKNTDHLVPAIFASFSLGCLTDVYGPDYEKSAVLRMLRMNPPDAVFCDIEVYELMYSCLKEVEIRVPIFTLNGLEGDPESVERLFKETGTEESFVPVEVDGINDALIKICSSGTTGTPKGVLLSHATVLASSSVVNTTTADDVILNFSTVEWISFSYTIVMACLSGAKRVITTQPFSPEFQLRLIEKFKVSFHVMPSFHMVLLMKSGLLPKANLSSIKLQRVGGTKVHLNTLKEYNTYLPNGEAFVAYGITEHAGAVTADLPEFSGVDTVGQLLGGCCVKVVDENGERCGVDIDGEICIKSPYLFLGYFGNDELTKEAFDHEGFFKTGDIGHVDANGQFFLVDREKDLLKYCRRKISPTAIEDFLLSNSEIEDCCVIGIRDELAGDLPAAAVVRKGNSQISEDDIYQMVTDHFPDYCKLRGGVYFLPSIPRTVSGGKAIRRRVGEFILNAVNAHA